MASGNPRFSELGKILIKVLLERPLTVLLLLNWRAPSGNDYWRTLLQYLTLTSIRLPDDAIYVLLPRRTPVEKPRLESLLSVVDPILGPVPWEDRDPTLVHEVHRKRNGYTLDVLKVPLRARDVVETTPRGDEYVVPNAVPSNVLCNVTNPDVVSESGLSKWCSSIYPKDKTYHDPFCVQTCVEEVIHANYATCRKPLFSVTREEPLKNGRFH